jgi:hypothetical protein
VLGYTRQDCTRNDYPAIDANQDGDNCERQAVTSNCISISVDFMGNCDGRRDVCHAMVASNLVMDVGLLQWSITVATQAGRIHSNEEMI